MNLIKKCWKDIAAIVLFVVISFFYFVPATIDGRVLNQHDAVAGAGSGQETAEYFIRTGEASRWTNAIFSGMPTYQMSPGYPAGSIEGKVSDAFSLWLPGYVNLVFIYLLGFYILLRAFNFREELATLGSIIWAFSSYFFIIIAAGHIWKVMALAYLPPMIGGIVLAYRGKYVWGLMVTSLFAALEVNANHPQMTYYYLFVILFMVIAFLADAIKKHEMERFWKATAVCAISAVLGIAVNISNLYHTWEYQKESMRGKSELVKKNTANQTSSGLDRDYITQWSYGIDETWTLLVPNVKGGASVPLARNEKAMAKADNNFMPIYQQLGQYWGEQPMTVGPVYVGAFVLMLFFLALFIVKGPMKWALLAATILSVLLSWGRNFMWFTNLFIDYMPMYAKFRAVSSILVIAEFTIPLLAVMGLKKIIDEPELLKTKMKYVWASFGMTAGVSLLFAVMPGAFFSDFVSSQEMYQFNQVAQNAQAQGQIFPLAQILDNLTEIRRSMLTADAWRSFWVVSIGMALLMLFKYKKLQAKYMVAGITVLCLVDMWMINKRYLYDDMFVDKTVRTTTKEMTETDKLICQDKSLDYRVLNLASNTFNENETSYFHKSIGGYNAAKLRRYQELIDYYISPEMQKLLPAIAKVGGDMTQVNGDSIFPVLNMLNTKYFIVGLQDGKTVPLQNPYVYGNAWFVDKITYAQNANEEIDGVGKINLRHEAVADQKFKETLGNAAQQSGTSMVEITSYEPNHLIYKVNSDKGGVLVFSEIYYPGWTATVDGQEVPVGRVNYVLRAINIKAGKHKVELDFHPKSIQVTNTISFIALGAICLALLLGIIIEVRKSRKQA